MAFQLSPGVNTSEIDLTTIVPNVGTTEGAFAAAFNWGPAEEIVSVSNEIELVDAFGRPDANTYEAFFTAANFLSYGRNLRVVRAVGSSALNASANGAGVLIKNRTDYETDFMSLGNNSIFAAKFPGDLGNSLKISLLPASASANFSSWAYATNFTTAPNTSTYVANFGGQKDEVHVAVIDEDGRFTGTAGTVLETFPFLSVASDAKKADGSSNYYVNVLNDTSKFVYVTNHPVTNSGWGVASSTTANTNYGSASTTLATGYTYSLANGVYSGTATDSDLTNAFNFFKNAEEVDVSLIITGSANTAVVQNVIDNIAEARKDCVAFVSPPRSAVVGNAGGETSSITTFRNNTLNKSSSYAFLDSGWKYQFDKYNNVYRWVPLNGDIAGLCVRTDFERDPWFSPAGFNRGQIKNVVKLAWNPNKSQRDDLYKIGVNPVVSFPGEGTVLYGDKTLLSKPSAFDRINVRRLFIVLEKAIARAAKYSLFEFNDEFTRSQFVALVEPYLRDVKGRRGIYDFRVVCDETNNTPEVIDRNEFVGDIYIKPARSINFIQLNFVAVRTGVAFDEIVGRF